VDTLTDRPAAEDPKGSHLPLVPRWRGRLHQVAFMVSIPLGLVLVALAGPAEAKVAAVVYSIGVSGLYGTSAAYHRGRWSPGARRWMQRLDHSMIFVLIAATYTPFALLVLDGTASWVLMIAVWTGAALGLVLGLTGLATKPGVGITLYIALGWVAVFAFPALLRELPAPEVVLMVIGGVVYTAGAIGLGTRWPDPSPRVFGYHEIWHVMTLIAGVCLGVVVWIEVIVA
jgi:hemolysin III